MNGLMPVRGRADYRPGRSAPRTYRLVGRLNLLLQAHGDGTGFDLARQHLLDWMRQRLGDDLPAQALAGESFRLEAPAATDDRPRFVGAVALTEPRRWAMRVDDNARQTSVWVTEATLQETAEGDCLCVVRLHCALRPDEAPEDLPLPAFIPAFMQDLDILIDGMTQALEPWHVDDADDVQDLVDLLTDPERRHDVIVLSLDGNDPDSAVLPGDRLQARLLGAAHVVLLSGSGSFRLTDIVGKEYSVFLRAVRTYRPGFDPQRDDPFQHHLALPQRIAGWAGGEGAEAFERFLAVEVMRRLVERRDGAANLPGYATLKAQAEGHASEQDETVADAPPPSPAGEAGPPPRITARASASLSAPPLPVPVAEPERAGFRGWPTEAQRQYVTQELARLRIELGEWQLRYARERDEAMDALAKGEDEKIALQERLADMEAALAAERARLALVVERTGIDLDEVAPDVPATLDVLEDWAARNLAGSIVILPRALKGARKAAFEDPGLVYRALLAMRDHYVPMRRTGGDTHRDAFEAALNALHLENSRSFAGERWGEQGEEYLVPWEGTKRLLEYHLKRGTSRDPRRDLRIYYFWDEASAQVVVGWLPSHLTTRAT